MVRTKETGASSQLRAVVVRYRAHNDRFERWLNERDAAQRERTRERFAGLSDEVRRELSEVHR